MLALFFFFSFLHLFLIHSIHLSPICATVQSASALRPRAAVPTHTFHSCPPICKIYFLTCGRLVWSFCSSPFVTVSAEMIVFYTSRNDFGRRAKQGLCWACAPVLALDVFFSFVSMFGRYSPVPY
jgi:hypothetical protein